MSSALHWESIGEEKASGWFLVLHGIFGRGRNWSRFAKAVSKTEPSLAFVLPDLRGHGGSQSVKGPHTLVAAAQDIKTLAEEVESERGPLLGVVGHSFGGKVATLATDLLDRDGTALWLLDSSPSSDVNALKRSGDSAGAAVSVLRIMERMDSDLFASRDDFYQFFTENGVSRPVAQWLGMQLVSEEGKYRFVLRPETMHSLLSDYYATDTWDFVEKNKNVHVVRAGQSSVISDEDAEKISGAAGCTLHTIEKAGHWLHVDALEELCEKFVRASAQGA